MKNITFILIIAILFCCCKDAYKHERPQYQEGKCVALDDFTRRVIGYDSVQITYFMDKWEANFCYPNQWEREKFKTIERLKSEGIIIGTQKGDLLLDNAVKTVYNK